MERKSDKEVLEQFRNGEEIKSEEERKVLKKWATAGLVTFGVDLETMIPEAKLTARGKSLVSMM